MNARRSILLGCALLVVAFGGSSSGESAFGEAAGAYPPLTQVTLAPSADGEMTLRVAGDAELRYHAFRLEDPDRVVLDLIGIAEGIPLREKIAAGFLREVRWGTRVGRQGDPVVRYVMETRGPADYTVEQQGNELTLRIARKIETATAAPGEAGAAEASPAIGQSVIAPAPLGAPWPAMGTAVGGAVTEQTTRVEGSAVAEPTAGTVVETAPELVAGAAPEPPAVRRQAVVGASHEPSDVARETPADAERPATKDAEEHPGLAATSAGAMSDDELAELVAALLEMDGTWATGETEAADQLKVASAGTGSSGATEQVIARVEPTVAARETISPKQVISDPTPPMSLDVQGADIHTVLRSIAEYATVNIVPDNNVQGHLTIRALDLSWREMLGTVCQSSGLTVLDQGEVIRVATQKTAREEGLAMESAARKQEEYMPLMTRVVEVNYANAKELQETVARSTSPRGHVETDGRTNSVILTDIEPRLDDLTAMIRRLDSETVQVEIAAKIVDVDATAARQLGISWGVQNLHSNRGNVSGSISVNADDVLSPTTQVQVGVIRSFGDMQAKLQALEQQNKAEIISAPRITTVNNRQARILVGKEVPLITLDFAGNAITELKKVGITLEVTPHVNEDGIITMDLHPEISDISSQSTAQGGTIFTTTEADTRVLVRNGETAVIGGLIRSAETKFERGVPYLRSIPLLGALFKSTDTRTEKRELLIFITPTLRAAGDL
ncbi:MAG: type IV pilus secretin PilQ [Candidatus Eisenbacteria sp.]|nr:type IV pilus secretin PilQ [Candidatus Eisenbacteria bacterium]